MRKRYLVLGLSVFLAVALAVPALGGPGNLVSDGATALKDTASKALKKAKSAKKAAKNAQKTADSAQSAADKAQSTADTAKSDAATAQTTAEAAQTTATAAQTAAEAAQTTADSKFGTVSNVEGTASASSDADKPAVFASCSGGSRVSGGGWIISGAGSDDSVVTFNTAYGQSWTVIADDDNDGSGGAWTVQATARCLAP